MGSVIRRGGQQRRPTQAHSYRILKVPMRLTWDDSGGTGLAGVVRFVEQLRNLAMSSSRPTMLCFRTCHYLDAVACLVLTAEVERCLIAKPGCILSREPKIGMAHAVLDAMGFFKIVGVVPRHTDAYANVLQIQSGKVPDPDSISTENPGEHVFNVAQLAMEAFGDETFADHVHAALNEAAENIIWWAYPASHPEALTSLRRWWVAGVTDLKSHRATFIAYDQGVGIAETAPYTNSQLLHRKIVKAVVAGGGTLEAPGKSDADILRTTIEERRTGSLRQGRGKGLTRMIDLIDLSKGGDFWIYTGWASYEYSRYANDNEPLEVSSAISFRFPGTLVVWSISGPRDELQG